MVITMYIWLETKGNESSIKQLTSIFDTNIYIYIIFLYNSNLKMYAKMYKYRYYTLLQIASIMTLTL